MYASQILQQHSRQMLGDRDAVVIAVAIEW